MIDPYCPNAPSWVCCAWLYALLYMAAVASVVDDGNGNKYLVVLLGNGRVVVVPMQLLMMAPTVGLHPTFRAVSNTATLCSKIGGGRVVS